MFPINVANILPGDDVLVELHYTELVAPTEGRYEFVFPTVVGPRYHKPSTAGGSSSFPATPYLKEGEAPSSTFAIDGSASPRRCRWWSPLAFRTASRWPAKVRRRRR